MAEREYQGRLMRLKTPAFSANYWEPRGEVMPVRVDLSSTPSKVTALLYAMRLNRGNEWDIEKYRLGLLDDSGNVFATIHATNDELKLHKAGYPVSASGYAEGDGDGSVPLASASNEQLIAELRRRLGGY